MSHDDTPPPVDDEAPTVVRPPVEAPRDERPGDTAILRHVEEATIDRQVVERGRARARKVVDERPVLVQVHVEVERFDVVREPVGRVVSNPDAIAWRTSASS